MAHAKFSFIKKSKKTPLSRNMLSIVFEDEDELLVTVFIQYIKKLVPGAFANGIEGLCIRQLCQLYSC
ncbi:hypothetical protein EMIT079MI2_140040 [Bacillus sp. IT-79MI2]